MNQNEPFSIVSQVPSSSPSSNSDDIFFFEKEPPLHAACRKGAIEQVVQLLQQSKDSINLLSNQYEETPLHVASESGHAAVVQLLLHSGAKISIVDRRTKNPLHLACEKGHFEVVKQLLLHQNDTLSEIMTQKDPHENTPLHIASQKGYNAIVDLLLNAQADPTLKNKEGQTPLHIACNIRNDMDRYEIVHLLLKKGVDRSVQDKNCKTPYDIAFLNEYTDVVNLFEQTAELKQSFRLA